MSMIDIPRFPDHETRIHDLSREPQDYGSLEMKADALGTKIAEAIALLKDQLQPGEKKLVAEIAGLSQRLNLQLIQSGSQSARHAASLSGAFLSRFDVTLRINLQKKGVQIRQGSAPVFGQDFSVDLYFELVAYPSPDSKSTVMKLTIEKPDQTRDLVSKVRALFSGMFR